MTTFTEDSVISKLMLDEAKSLCTTLNLPLSVRVATNGLLSAKVPSAETILGCIYERERDRNRGIRKASQAALFFASQSSDLSHKTTGELHGSGRRARFPLPLELDEHHCTHQSLPPHSHVSQCSIVTATAQAAGKRSREHCFSHTQRGYCPHTQPSDLLCSTL